MAEEREVDIGGWVALRHETCKAEEAANSLEKQNEISTSE